MTSFTQEGPNSSFVTERMSLFYLANGIRLLLQKRCRYARVRGGHMARFYNAASVPSTAQAGIRDAERAVLDHVVMRHGTPEQRQHVAARREAESMLTAAKLQYAAASAATRSA